MKLTVEKVIAVHSALFALIHTDREVKFNFPLSARFLFALNLNKTKPVVDEYIEQKNILVKELGVSAIGADGKETFRVSDENAGTFEKQNEELLAKEFEVALEPLTKKELGENQIPIDLLSALIDTGLVIR